MESLAISSVLGLVDAFTNTAIGRLVVGVMLLGTSVALFRWLEAGAGGRDV